MRKKLTDLLINHGYKVYSIGQIETPLDYPYLVLLMNDNSSIGNPYGSKQLVEILCYVPDTSIFQLDPIIEDVQDIIRDAELADDFEGIGTDFHDTELNAYMRNIKFYIPIGNIRTKKQEVE